MCAVLCAQESRSLTARGGKGPLPSFDSSGDEGEEDDDDDSSRGAVAYSGVLYKRLHVGKWGKRHFHLQVCPVRCCVYLCIATPTSSTNNNTTNTTTTASRTFTTLTTTPWLSGVDRRGTSVLGWWGGGGE